VNTTLSQAKVTLGVTDKELELLKVKSKMLEHVFAKAFLTLKEGQTISKSEGEFFLSDGRKQKSEIVYIGHIAKLALIDNKYGALVPVGGRKFRLDNENTLDKNTLLSGGVGRVAPMFIFESMEKAIEPKKEKTFMQIMKAGGLIGYVIVGLGLLALVLMMLRGAMLWKVGRYDDEVINSLNDGDLGAVEKGLESGETSFARVLKKTLEAKDLELDKREHVINESILGELQFLDKFGSIILVMAAVAPLLGLLGTVSGMISTFDIITEFGTGDPKLLSSGISEALITTKLGLIVAIPTLLMGNLFSGWSNKIKVMLEREALRLSNFVGREA
jgi:biopolymer transport protein ExbB